MTPTEAARIAAQEQEWRGLLLEWQEMLEKVKPQIDRLTARAEAAEAKLAKAQEDIRFWAEESAGHEVRAARMREALAATLTILADIQDQDTCDCEDLCSLLRAALESAQPSDLLSERREEFKAQLHRAETHPDEPTVHALWNGIAECGLSIMAAGEWPQGHRWVRRGEPGVNCGVCLAVQAKVKP